MNIVSSDFTRRREVIYLRVSLPVTFSAQQPVFHDLEWLGHQSDSLFGEISSFFMPWIGRIDHRHGDDRDAAGFKQPMYNLKGAHVGVGNDFVAEHAKSHMFDGR